MRMDLNQQIEIAERRVKENEKELECSKVELHTLLNCEQPSIGELFSDIDKYITYSVAPGEYEYILGGDGRSTPWSEMRKAVIATISTKPNIYISKTQEMLVMEYFLAKHQHNGIKKVIFK